MLTKIKMDKEFEKRLKSFLWRLGSYLVISGLAWISDNAGVLELSPAATTILALISGELTKALNKK